MSELFPELAEYMYGHFPELAQHFGFPPPQTDRPATMREATPDETSRLVGSIAPAQQATLQEPSRIQQAMMAMPQPVQDVVDRLGSIASVADSLGANPNGVEGAQVAMAPILGRAAEVGDGPVFYSRLRQLIEDNPQKAWTGEQLKGFLSGKAAKDELAAVEPLFGQSKIVKDDLLKHLDANGINLEERVLGGSAPAPYKSIQQVRDLMPADNLGYDTREQAVSALFNEGPDGYPDIPDDLLTAVNEMRAEREAHQSARAAQPKFSKYQLNDGNGAENYKEILVKTPTKAKTELPPGYSIQRMANGEFTLARPDGSGDILSGSRTQEEATSAAIHRLEISGRIERSSNFRSGHYPDDPNTLVHVRLNDRKTVNGEPVKFLEEVQSDWHQKGREKGYLLPESERKARVQELIDKQKQLYDHAVANGLQKDPAANDEYMRLAAEQSELERVAGKVPEAPFKSTDKWTELGVRRALRDAAESDSKYFAWTTGEQQTARYDLSKQIDGLSYRQNRDGTYRIVIGKGSRSETLGEQITQDKLADYVGKDLANKIVNNATDRVQNFYGLDLKVGGEGMKSFYDGIVPKVVQKIGKKYGAKIQQVDLGNGLIQPAIEITPQMRQDILKGQPLASNEQDDRERIA